jgi:WD40 repeat protein
MVTSLSSTTANYNPNKDIEVVQPPSDSISDLAFSPLANFLAASSWDNQVSNSDERGVDRWKIYVNPLRSKGTTNIHSLYHIHVPIYICMICVHFLLY